jgi:regulation of enolase protein 1 (concanavalin A-like superfamily)
LSVKNAVVFVENGKSTWSAINLPKFPDNISPRVKTGHNPEDSNF